MSDFGIFIPIGKELFKALLRTAPTYIRISSTIIDALRDHFSNLPETDKGTAFSNGHPVLDLDRCVGDFVAFNTGLCTELQYYESLIRDYIARKTDKPLNILILAPPGSGKTFLAKQIKESISSGKPVQPVGQRLREMFKSTSTSAIPDVSYSECQVSSFTSVKDLISFLSRLAGVTNGNKVPFAFFDEVDARMGTEYAYKYLLAPMADGVFLGGDEPIRIGKSVLFFAGSSLFSLDDKVIADLRRNRLSYGDYRKIVVDQVKASMAQNIERRQRHIELPFFTLKLPSVRVFQSPHTVEKAIDFIDRMNIYICLPRGDFQLTDTEPERFLSCKIGSAPYPLADLEDLISERLSEISPGSQFALENLIIAIVLIEKHFRVALVDLDAALFIASILQESPTRRVAESIIQLSHSPRNGRFNLSDVSLYTLEPEMNQQIADVLTARNSYKRMYVRLK